MILNLDHSEICSLGKKLNAGRNALTENKRHRNVYARRVTPFATGLFVSSVCSLKIAVHFAISLNLIVFIV